MRSCQKDMTQRTRIFRFDEGNMQDLMNALAEERQTLSQAIAILKERGINKAKAERDYRIALAQEELRLKAEKMPATLIMDLSRGNELVADLRMERDIAEALYETCQQKIYQSKKEIDIILLLMQAERKGE
jgi:translation elongation factor EF-Ts